MPAGKETRFTPHNLRHGPARSCCLVTSKPPLPYTTSVPCGNDNEATMTKSPAEKNREGYSPLKREADYLDTVWQGKVTDYSTVQCQADKGKS